MSEHALLSASSSHRWLHCPPSAMLAAQYPNKDTAYTKAGTLAHAIAELKARKHFVEPMSARTFNSRLKKLKEDPAYDPGMDASTDLYLEHLKQLAMAFSAPPFVALETKVDYSHIAPNGFGTADCIMIAEGKMHIVDYKNGAGVPVEAEDNPQMMLYGLGALKVYGPIYGDSIREIYLHIVQPNAGGVKSWSLTREDLEKWGESIKPIAALAAEGKGEYTPGPWCDAAFCPAKATCRKRAEEMLATGAIAAAAPDPAELNMDELGALLPRLGALSKWISDVQDYALSSALGGKAIPGHKLVEGRGSRDWTDLDQAFTALQERGVPEAMLWERKPASVAGLEKALGKKDFAEKADGLVVKKPGKPALVPESDKRPTYNPAAAAFTVI